MTQDQQHLKDLAGRYVEAFNQQNFDMLDAVLAPDFVDHDPLLPGLPAGREGEKVFAKQVLDAFPDLFGNIQDIVAEGDKVVSRITWTGTQRGTFLDIPASGKTFGITEIHMMRAANGRIVEHWTGFDQLGMLQQLEVLPATSPAEWHKAFK